MHSQLLRLDRWLDKHVPILSLLLFMLVLRLPNFAEPYWYGDEGIYLTVGTALAKGERLYLQIIDHKTPLIYYLAMAPTQFWFRIENLIACVIMVVIFYRLSLFLFKRIRLAMFTTLLFIILTTLPWFEGNIPNGELFVMTFVLLGAACLMKTMYFRQFFKPDLARDPSKRDKKWLLLSGGFFGLGILTKVPGLFDAAAFLSLGWFQVTSLLPIISGNSHSFSMRHAVKLSRKTLLILTGILIPILLSILYYVLRGSGQAYLDYGLLYNFRYAGNWQLPFESPILLQLFTLPGKAALVGVWLVLMTVGQRWFSRRFIFCTTWFWLSLFASLLSNRPYPHYFLQTFPALALLAGEVLLIAAHTFSARRLNFKTKLVQVFELFTAAISLCIFFAVLELLQVHRYPTAWYYQQFGRLVTNQISSEEYRNSFNPLMKDNYAAAKIITNSPDPYLFIWGTNPMLYALTQKTPPGRFTVLFHIRDFQAEHQTIEDVKRVAPEYIVVMKEDAIDSELRTYLLQMYMPNDSFEHFELWKKLAKPL